MTLQELINNHDLPDLYYKVAEILKNREGKNSMEEFNNLAQLVKEDDLNKKDIRVKMSDIVMNQDGRVVMRGHTNKAGLKVSDHAMTQAFNFLKMPTRYEKKLMDERPDLVAKEFNHWAWQRDNEMLLRCRITDKGKDGYIRGFLTNKYSVLDNNDVVNMLEATLGTLDVKVEGTFLDDRRTHIRITFSRLSFSLGKALDGNDDELKVGVDIDNSEVGESSLRVVPLIYRLVCTNGLRAWRQDGDVFEQRHLYLKREEIQGRLSDAIDSALKVGDKLVDRISYSTDVKLKSPLDTIEELAKQAKYSDKTTDAIKSSYMIEPMPSLYGVVNAFTRTAHTLENEKQVEMEQFAGDLLSDENLKKFKDK
jgi:hypothetical protein